MNVFTKLAVAAFASVMATVSGAGIANAAWEPNKPITFIIMAGKGGGADKMARFIQSVVEKNDLSARPLVPTNKSGGGGAEALIAAKNASDPDHTIMVTLNSFFTAPLRRPDIKADIMDFAPVGRLAEDTFLLWVHKDSGITDFEGFLKQAKADGNKWVMGGTGTNSEDNIITDFLNSEYGLDMKYFPLSGGGAVATALAGKQIKSSVNNPSEALGFYEAGQVVPLVAFTDERLPLFGDVPTLKEKGSDFSYFMQRAVVGAPGMSRGAQKYYTDLFKKVYESDEWQKYKKDKSLLGDHLAGRKLKSYWKTQRDRHEKILRASGAIK